MIVIVFLFGGRATAIPSFTVALYPTVASGEVTIEIYNAYLAHGGIRSAKVYSTDGSIIKDLTNKIDKGRIGLQVITLDVGSYAGGVYILTISTGGPPAFQKFVKVG